MNPSKKSAAVMVRSPRSALRAWSSASRARATAGSSAAGSAWARLPPSMAPGCGWASWPIKGSAAASRGRWLETVEERSAARSVVMAPMVTRPRPPVGGDQVDALELGHPTDVHQRGGASQAEGQEGDEALAAGQDLGVGAVPGEEAERLLDRGGVVIAETGRLHRGETRPPPGQSQGIDCGGPRAHDCRSPKGVSSSDLRPGRRGQAAGRRPLGTTSGALRRGLRPQHPHRRPSAPPGTAFSISSCRARGALDALDAGLRHRLSQLRARGPRSSRHRRRLRARDARRGAAQGGGARRLDPLRGGRCRAAPVRARQLRPRRSAAMCSGHCRTRRRRSTSGSGSCGRVGAWSSSTVSSTPGASRAPAGRVPARATSTRRSATSFPSSAAGRGRRSRRCSRRTASSTWAAIRCSISWRPRRSGWSQEGRERRTHRRYVAWGDVRRPC